MRIIKAIGAVILLPLIGGWGYAQFQLATEEHAYLPVTDEQLETAQSYLATAADPFDDGWAWGRFEPEDGIELRAGSFEPAPADPLGVVIVIPGYTAPLEMLAYSINRFHRAGYVVHGIEYRGQGLSTRLLANPEKGHVEDYAVLASDIGAFADSVRTADLPLHIYAVSQGAHITMRMAGDDLGRADSYALIVPMAKIFTGGFPYAVARGLADGLTYSGLGEMFAPGRGQWNAANVTFGSETACNANPQRAQLRDALFALDARKRVDGPTARWVHETIVSTDTLMTPDYAGGISEPVIMFTAGQDTIVDTEASAALCDMLGNCERQHFESSRHCIGLETDAVRDEIIDAALAHFGDVAE